MNTTHTHTLHTKNATPNGPVSLSLGQIVMTRSVENLICDASHLCLIPFIARHKSGDWGNLCEEDKQLNNEAVHFGGRILSSYQLMGQKIYIITEANRSLTTILLPSEY